MNADTEKIVGTENRSHYMEGLLMDKDKDTRCYYCQKIPVCIKCGKVLCETPGEAGCHLCGHFKTPEGPKCLKCYDKDEKGGDHCKIFLWS
ncbi:MAG: hypothetical protein ACD_15C00083G0002 [uncultured bacterium]|nr:MAG: hypothetical protein ACD_15C00083G0002 [uncultured bacterium]HCU70481.1 hypothetical protein [Candidatus Moranbacteria bacterium]